MPALMRAPRFDPTAADRFLQQLSCAPGGFGMESADALCQAVAPAEGHQTRLLFLLGEPLSGKSTLLSNLLVKLWHAGPGASGGQRFAIVRWGDAQRAQRKLGLLPAERVLGDLTAPEYANLSDFVSDRIEDALAEVGDEPGLVVAEFPGCTAVYRDGRIQGFDRGFSTLRAFAADERAYFVAVQGDASMRQAYLAARNPASASTSGSTADAGQSAAVIASRIDQQMTDLARGLAAEGRLTIADPAAFDNPDERDLMLWEHFWPYLLRTEIGVPADRTLLAFNRPLPADLHAATQVDGPFLEQFDFIRARFQV